MKSIKERISNRLLKSEPLKRCTLEGCKAACCFDGVWVDQTHADDILAQSDRIIPHTPKENKNPNFWFDERIESDPQALSGYVLHTTVVPNQKHYLGTACIFLRKDHKCALQVAAIYSGLHPWRLKPFYCILHPLDIDQDGKITLDKTIALLNEPGSCLQPSRKEHPLLDTFSEELKYLIGDLQQHKK